MSDLIVPIPPLQRCLICLSPCIVLKGPLFKGQRSFARSRPVVLSAIDSYLRSIHRDRDGSSLLASSLRRRCSARRTGNTKVLGKHSPFSCHFAAIKRPSSLLCLRHHSAGLSLSHRPSRLPPATVCYGYGLVLTEV